MWACRSTKRTTINGAMTHEAMTNVAALLVIGHWSLIMA
jgi:hypothetical protein